MYSWMSCSDIAGVWKKRIEEKRKIYFLKKEEQKRSKKKFETILQFEKVDAFLKC
jgi:hypothetical protein